MNAYEVEAASAVVMPAVRVNDMARFILAAMDANGFETPRTLAWVRGRKMTVGESTMLDAVHVIGAACEVMEAARKGNPDVASEAAEDTVVCVDSMLARLERGEIAPSAGMLTPGRLFALKCGLIATEAAEAMEAAHNGNVQHVAEELADIIIRVLHLAAGLGLDMDGAISGKMAANVARPYRHGKATGA